MASQPTLQERLQSAAPFDPWPEPGQLPDQLLPVVEFDPALLPGELRAWVMDIAERMNCPPDLVAIPAMVAAGSLIGRRVGIRPQCRTDWQEAANLWGCVVARPGSMKSPAASEALAPLRRLEAKAAQAFLSDQASHKAAEALFKLEKEHADKTARSAMKDKGKGAALAAFQALAEPEPPMAKRFLTSDANAASLGEICKANPDGVLVHRDELLSLFTDLDQSEKASERGFFMSGWGGQDGYTFDRIGRGTVRIPAVNISLFGTTQPTRLAAYMRDSLKRFDDGMVQRLQLLAWPDFSGEFREVDRFPDTQAKQAAYACFEQLANLDTQEIGAELDEYATAGAVPFLRFCGEAQEGFRDWRRGLERQLRDDELPQALVAHMAKFRGLIPRLALVHHLASGGRGPVSAEAAIQSWRWADYLGSHARRAYASLGLDNAEAARAIWRRVRKGDLPSSFTARDIRQKGWSGLTAQSRIEAGLEALVQASWLRPIRVETGGRPSDQYQVNPKALAA